MVSHWVISQETKDHLEKSCRQDGTEAEDESSGAWQRGQDNRVRTAGHMKDDLRLDYKPPFPIQT